MICSPKVKEWALVCDRGQGDKSISIKYCSGFPLILMIVAKGRVNEVVSGVTGRSQSEVMD